MAVIHDARMLRAYVEAAVGVTPDRPILIDKFPKSAIEAQADAVAAGADGFVPAAWNTSSGRSSPSRGASKRFGGDRMNPSHCRDIR